ncbi:MAG: RNA polymerase-associated protein RapA [Moraxella sp.]|nr:RNA polymerase-associated protein RapA [Moraxella sp.]
MSYLDEFAIGQRYLSDNESNLGLGVVIDLDERSVHVLFPQSEETRIYAKSSAALSRVVFGCGDTVTDQDGVCYVVERVEDIKGVVRYHLACGKSLMETRLTANVNLAKPLEKLLAGQIERHDWYELRQDALKLSNFIKRHPLRGLIGARVDIIPHQLYIAHEVGKRLSPRVLLADEVGLGKTIEAGLILHQQLTTGKAQRVLILVPDSLQYQWLIELKRRFNLDFALFDLVRTASIKEHNPDQNVFATEQCIIASIDLLLDHADLFEQAYAAGFDMLVVDEAHHLHWDEVQGGNDKYELIAAFAESVRGLLLLTATPEQLGLESHFARLRLLDKDRFDDLDAFVQEQEDFALVAQMATALIDGVQLSDKQIAAVAGLLGFAANDLAQVNEDDRLRNQLVNDLLDRHGTGRVLFRNTRDSVAGFHGRQNIAYPLPLPDAWQNTAYIHGKLREQLWGEESFPDGSWLENDPRVPWLMKLLKEELRHQKVLLIARSGTTIEALEAALRLHANIRTAVFSEQMSLLERDQAAAYFADESGAQILLCSEIGSEGRNFQFAHHLVLFDLPANPDTLEQRIGRLDRIGQSQKITLHTPFVMGTASERLYHWYDGALNIFNQISPTAQNVQEQFIAELKPLLEADDTADNRASLETLVADGAALRLELEDRLQAGRDRLLEYNSCRPKVAERISQSMAAFDDSELLPKFVDRLFNSLNVDYSIQRDGSWIVHPIDSGESADEVVHLPIGEDGMTMSFARSQALVREDMAYMTHEHPFMLSAVELLTAGSFGNTSVATLRSAAMPQGMLLLEVNFRIESIAPKALNLNAYLPNQLLRVLLTEQGDDLSTVATAEKITPLIERLDRQRARQVVKVRAGVIANRFGDAQTIAKAQLAQVSNAAKSSFTAYFDKEINRLTRLQAINPSIRDTEIAELAEQKEQGLYALEQLALVSDSMRVLVVVNS